MHGESPATLTVKVQLNYSKNFDINVFRGN